MLPSEFIREFLQAGGKLCKKSGALQWAINNAPLMEKATALFPSASAELLGMMAEGDTWLDTTPSQQRFWVEDYMLDTQEYNMISRMSYHVPGAVDPEKLQATLMRLVRRHETFRTNFTDIAGYPVQVVHESGHWPFVVYDLRDLEGDELKKRVSEITLETIYAPMDIAREPLVRTSLMRFADASFRVVFGMHHIAVDGSAVGVMLPELGTLYNSASPDECELPDVTYTMEDHLQYLRQWRESGAKGEAEEFWKNHLTDLKEIATIPTLPKHLCKGGAGGTMLTLPFPPDLRSLLYEAAKRLQITKYQFFLTTYVIYLHRVTGLDEITLGPPYACRPTEESRGFLGLCVNTMPIRIHVNADDTFDSLYPKVVATLKGAMAHGMLPFQEICACSKVTNDIQPNNHFQTVYIYQNMPPEYFHFDGAIAQNTFDHNLRYINFHTLFELFDRHDELKWQVTFRNDCYSEKYILDCIKQIENVMRGVVSNSDKPIHKLDLFSPGQLLEQTVAWNATSRPYPAGESLVSLFEEVAHAHSESPALLSAEGALSYGELNRRANRLAHCLAARGVGLEDPVAIFLPRSADAIIAVLGILKAGAAYVPVDVDFPASRVAQILRTTQTKCVVSSRAAHFALEEYASATLDLDVARDAIFAHSGDNFPCPATGASLAYVMFTSGSTGEAKGVGVEHRNIARYLLNADYFDYDHEQRWLMFAPMAFDGSTTEIWGAFLHGASLSILPAGMPTLHELGAFIQAQGVTSLFLTPSLFNQMVDDQLESLGGIKQCTIGGDIVSVEHARRFLRAYPGRHLLNGYGPTETTACATAYSMFSVEDVVHPVPIGKPINNTRCYVLDPHGQPVPIGVEGELHIGGDGVSRGYINNAAQNAELFVTLHIPGVEAPERVYKSGDMARWLPDGNLEFLGRRDKQVKLRGFRIELGEIEAVLRTHPDVSESVVLLQEGSKHHKRLDAYITLDEQYNKRHGEVEVKQVDQWRTLYEETCSPSSDKSATLNNFIGWNSSYTGEAIPEEEMIEWAEATARQLRGFGARRVLELGCGTGLLIGRIAPGTSSYLGVDFSEMVLRHARMLVESREELRHVRFHHGPADELSFLGDEQFDLIILNSVVQYFPSINYLREVLQQALAHLAPGGLVYLGDIRALPLHEHYAFSVLLHQAKGETPLESVMDTARRNVQREEELLVAPEFFHALREDCPAICEVRISPKEGRFHNELSKFRYEVQLHTRPVENPIPYDWLDWEQLAGGLETLDSMLAAGDSEVLALKGIPNARLVRELFAMRQLKESDPLCATACALKAATLPCAVEVDELFACAQKRGLNVFIDWSDMGEAGKLNALFYPPAKNISLTQQATAKVRRPWRTYANNPLQAIFARQVVPKLRHHLQGKLPEYMVPANYAVIEKFPLNKNGKIDRSALARLAAAFNRREEEYVAPRSEMEKFLAACFEELLVMSQVGAYDNFFDLGGHSLLATQLISRIQEKLGRTLLLRQFFEEPTVAAFATKVELAPDSATDGDKVAKVDRATGYATFPMSFAQQRLWIMNQIDPRSAAYNMPYFVSLKGRLDLPALDKALREIVSRHEILRTTFGIVEEQPMQKVSSEANFKLAIFPLHASSESPCAKAQKEHLESEFSTPFDLAQGPLFRGRLVQLAEAEHLLLLCMHHIVSDGWSLGILANELTVLYNDFLEGRPSSLSPLHIQYADFAVWQHNYLQGEVRARQEKYWLESLRGIGPSEFPAMRPRPAIMRHEAQKFAAAFPKSLHEKLGAFCKERNVTLYMAALAGFFILQHRYTGKVDLSVGSPIANRNRREIEGLIGFFVNTLVMRTQVTGDMSFEALLLKVQDAALCAYENQDIPFEHLVEKINPIRDSSRNPLFQIMFAVQNISLGNLNLKGLDAEIVFGDLASTRFDMEVNIWAKDAELICCISYNSSLYDAWFIEQVCTHWFHILENALDCPNAPIAALGMLSPEQLLEQTVSWNATARPYPKGASLASLFEEVVRTHADAPALRFTNGMLSYRELNARANQLAHCLASRGVGLEDRVAIFLPRSADAIVAILGILKVGAGYVPVDVDFPEGRVAEILRATNAKCVVCSKAVNFTLGEYAHIALDLDDALETIAAYPSENFPCPAKGDNLAYIMFTSGSTGEAKGVGVEHHNITRYLLNADYFDYDDKQRWLMFAPMAFDGSTTEIWGALLHGAGLSILSAGMPTLHELGAFIVAQGVTSLFLTPSLFNQMVDYQLESLCGVRQCMLGGDIVSVEHARHFLRAYPGKHLLNGYGPTETTVYATSYSMHCVGDVVQPIPIGKPISNTRCYVLDTSGQAVPPGVEGELYIGGDGVSRGYINNAEQNAEHFVSLQLPGMGRPERVYKSGDMVRWLPDGNLEFMGRRDKQIKLNGFRIELGEIEVALCREPSLSEAVVVLQAQGAELKKLAAFVTVRPGAEFNRERIMAHLSALLPPIMVPHHYAEVKSWPMTATGKIDRLVLENLQTEASPAQERFETPQGRTEEEMATLWKELLGVERVGRHDNFFALGGHSLKATRLLSSIRLKYGREIGFYELFQHPTLSAFAGILTQYDNDPLRMQNMSSEDVANVGAAQWHTKFPMSFAQQRLWLINQIDPGNAAYNMPYFMLLKGRLNVAALEKALNEIVARHETLRTTFGTHEGQPVQRVSAKPSFVLRVIPLEGDAGADKEAMQGRHAAEEFSTPFDLSQGPLFRGRLVQVGEEEFLLLLCMHHIISDGWSFGVLTRELSVLYGDFAEGKPSSLPALGIQYADFTLWQREYLKGDVRKKQETYWLDALKGMEPVEIPTNHLRPAKMSHEARKYEVALSGALASKLDAVCHERNLTLFMAALAGFFVLQHRYTGQCDLSVGSPIANRNRHEVEGLIGFFVNTLVMRTRVTGDMTFSEVLKNVQDAALSAYDNQDLPFEYLVEKLNPERDSSRNPLFQIMFAVQNVNLGTLKLKDIELGMLRGDMASTRFDMEVHLWPNDKDLKCSIYFNATLYEPWFVKQLCTHWLNVLENGLDRPQSPISQISFMSGPELLRETSIWNQDFRPYPQEVSVVAFFEKAVARYEGKKALVSPYATLTYGELNASSNRLAHYLRSRGVGLEDRVALLMSRNPMTVVAILGILKTGAAYVPIDVDFPISRIRFMLQDTQSKFLITESQIGVDLEEFGDSVIRFDELPKTLESFPTENMNCEAKGNNLAYIMYTSGSTGTPKGVCVEHRNISRLVMNTDYMDFDEGQTWLMFSPLAFDASTVELWGSLLHGGTLAVYPSFLPSLNELGTFIKDYKVTSLFLSTSLFNQLVDQQSDDFSGVGQCVTGGEIMSVEHVRRLMKTCPNLKLANVYGPTECTTFSTIFPLASELDVPDPVPIGRPLPNTTCYILDGYGQPVPPGVTGELHIGGGGVARGYLNSPELTSERFVSLQLPGMQEPERVYKTGDLARYLPDGEIEFIGRRDHQIKMRGFRIELGEIESALRAHPDINEAVVLLQESASHNKSLAAYITLDENFNRSHENVEGEQVDHWLSLYDETYAPETEKSATINNFLGWNSSYTGQPIPEEEMLEWAEATTARLKKLGAKRVLEMGCGTGLLIGRIAPGTDSYIGVDFSEMVLKHTRALVASQDELKHVRLFHKRVDDLAEFSAERFDLIILNSVVQYFPSIDYLLQVIRGATALLAPGGVLYLGDLRAFPLHEQYTLSVQLHQAKDDLPLGAILDTARRNAQREEELLVSPDFFYALQEELPQITRVMVSPKAGKFHNELTKFRYEVELHTAPVPNVAPIVWISWNTVGDLAGLGDLLARNLNNSLAVKGIPNARLALENFALRQADEAEPVYADAGKIRSAPIDAGVEPDALYALAASSGHSVFLDWSDMAEGGALNAVFYPTNFESFYIPMHAKVRRPWRTYANNPLQVIFAREIVPKLRQYLLEQLPEYMVPANYAVIEKFPLNKNGKIDRKALDRLAAAFNKRDAEYVAPKTETEKFLAACFEELLGISQVGVRDNFFDLGGHSLLATQFISRIQEKLHKTLPLRLFFEEPTVAAFAPKVDAAPASASNGDGASSFSISKRAKSKEELLMERLSQLSEDDLNKMLQQLDTKES